MNKIWLVARREFSVRVRKKSFFVLTLLAPVLMALLVTVPAYIMSMKDGELKLVAVVDESRSFDSALVSTEAVRYTFLPAASVDSIRRSFAENNYYALLYISELNDKGEPREIKFYSNKQVSLDVQQAALHELSGEVEQRKLKAYNIQGLSQIVKDTRTKLKAETVKWSDDGREQKTHVGIAMGISYAAALLIYTFIFMFGSMVMRGVIEEKVNRIVEVIVSSVKPFQLMMGKIVGVALVGLLQFALWIVLTLALITAISAFLGTSGASALPSGVSAEQMANLVPGQVSSFLAYLSGFNFSWITLCFVLFFLGGYLLYSSLFAAVGSAVESEADTQQLMVPITVPMILAIMVMLNTFQHPDSALSFWFSIIPFTSPVVMMARIPFDVPTWQVALSLALLYATFVGMVWLAGKIYRTGILMYGKKATFKEMWKWLKYNS